MLGSNTNFEYWSARGRSFENYYESMKLSSKTTLGALILENKAFDVGVWKKISMLESGKFDVRALSSTFEHFERFELFDRGKLAQTYDGKSYCRQR